RNADKTGVRATFDVKSVGAYAIKAGSTNDTFAINGVTIGKVDYSNGDENGSLISAINSVKDTTGVQASKDENGKLVLT
ncbi:flagellin, partial [Campylobacter jejuni]